MDDELALAEASAYCAPNHSASMRGREGSDTDDALQKSAHQADASAMTFAGGARVSSAVTAASAAATGSPAPGPRVSASAVTAAAHDPGGTTTIALTSHGEDGGPDGAAATAGPLRRRAPGPSSTPVASAANTGMTPAFTVAAARETKASGTEGKEGEHGASLPAELAQPARTAAGLPVFQEPPREPSPSAHVASSNVSAVEPGLDTFVTVTSRWGCTAVVVAAPLPPPAPHDVVSAPLAMTCEAVNDAGAAPNEGAKRSDTPPSATTEQHAASTRSGSTPPGHDVQLQMELVFKKVSSALTAPGPAFETLRALALLSRITPRWPLPASGACGS